MSRNRTQTGHFLGGGDEPGEPVGGVNAGDVVDVDHRRLNVGVAHVRLHVGERERLDGERPERVPEVVQAEAGEARLVERGVEAVAEPPVVQMAARVVHEHEVVESGEPLAAAERVERLRRLVDQRHRSDAAGLRRLLCAVRVVAPDVDESLREVDVVPLQRAKLPEPKAGEGGHAEQGRVLFALGGPGERLDLGRVEDGEVAGAPLRLSVNERDRVRAEPVDAHRPAEDSVHDDEALVDRPRGQPSLLHEFSAVGVDPLGRDGLEGEITELGIERVVNDAPVISDRGRAALPVVLDVTQPLC